MLWEAWLGSQQRHKLPVSMCARLLALACFLSHQYAEQAEEALEVQLLFSVPVEDLFKRAFSANLQKQQVQHIEGLLGGRHAAGV